MNTSTSTALDDTSPTICLFTDGWDWDHYLLFAMTEINSGKYNETLGNLTFQHKFLFVDPDSPLAEGNAQAIFAENYKSCHVFVGPGWSSLLSAVGQWAGVVQKPIITGGAVSPKFSEESFRYVTRSVPSEIYVVEAYIELIDKYDLSLINIVYSNDEYGTSTQEAFVERADDRFEIEWIRSFENENDTDTIDDILNEIEASPTQITFVSVASRDLSAFLNAAGKRGLHETQLWLSPAAETAAESLEIPPNAAIWAGPNGEELTEEDRFAQDYLAKDLAPHIQAHEMYGFNDQYNTLTYWGSYYYEAVLAAAHALAAAKNRSNGEEVLNETLKLSLENVPTGVLKMDKNGDRVGARIPIVFMREDGEAEKFAVYNGTSLETLREPLWPGGSTAQPDLIREEASATKVGAIVGGVLGGLVLMLGCIFFLHYNKSKKAIRYQTTMLLRTQNELTEREKELKELHETIGSSIGTTKYGDAIEFISDLMDDDRLRDEKDKLKLVKNCLVKGNDGSMHIPQNLDADEEAFIMKEFAGVSAKKTFGTRRAYHPSTRNFNQIMKASKQAMESSFSSSELECIPEFTALDISKQQKLFELLSFSSLQKWSFNVFDVADIDEPNTLLFVSWAVICSPYSQIAMAKELQKAGVDTAQDSHDIDGYGFLFGGLGYSINNNKLIHYIRLMQEGYQDTPYHNRIHAADVVQTLNSLLQMAGDSFTFEKEDLFLLLLSSVVHDVKHPGRNNAFQVNSFSELALKWNDISVLESEHISHAFHCMIKDEECHFIQNADPAKLHDIRKKMIDAVLHTDMSKHFAGVSKIKATAAGKSWVQLEPNVRWEVLIYMMHMADISNPAKGDPMCKLWTERCLEEFFQQGDKEREMGVPISPNCDRTVTKTPDSQIGFIKFVVQPAYEVLGDIVPGVKQNILPVIENNLAYWNEQKKLNEVV